MKQPAVYILASKRNGTLYIGMTTDLIRRVYEHRIDAIEGFTKKYNVKQLVWYQLCESIEGAALVERQMKKWNRDWKIQKIEEMNPEWEDLYPSLLG
jgi:putative endonuclease